MGEALVARKIWARADEMFMVDGVSRVDFITVLVKYGPGSARDTDSTLHPIIQHSLHHLNMSIRICLAPLIIIIQAIRPEV